MLKVYWQVGFCVCKRINQENIQAKIIDLLSSNKFNFVRKDKIK